MSRPTLVALSFALFAAGCGRSAVAPASTAPQPVSAVPPTVIPVAPPPAPAPVALFRLTDELPGSTSHQWGLRTFEGHQGANGWRVRVHDITRFQGSGMEPHQMPPPSHQCTPWIEPSAALAAQLTLGSETRCTSSPTLCAALRAELLSAQAADQPARGEVAGRCDVQP